MTKENEKLPRLEDENSCPNCGSKLGEHEWNIEQCMTCGSGFKWDDDNNKLVTIINGN